MLRAVVRRLPLPCSAVACLLAPALLAGCATVSLDPTPAPPPAPVVSDADRYPPPRIREAPPSPIETPLPAAEAPAISLPSTAVATPLPPPPASEATAPPRAGIGAAPSVPGPAPTPDLAPARPTAAPARSAAASSAPAATDDSAAAAMPGRWSVQVGVFAVAQNAETIRARVAQRLLERPLPGATLRTVRRDGRLHVLVGDLPNRASAQRLATQLRDLLQQDVVLFRW